MRALELCLILLHRTDLRCGLGLGAARTLRRVLVPSLLLVSLLACAEALGPNRLAANDDTGRLFARAYGQVMEYYLEPLTAKEAALRALQRLGTLDPDLTVSADGDAIELREASLVIDHLPLSPERDARGLGVVTSAALRDAKAH